MDVLGNGQSQKVCFFFLIFPSSSVLGVSLQYMQFNASSHLYGITVNHHKYDAAGVCCTANTKVQEVVLQTGRQDQWLFTPGDKQQAPHYTQTLTLPYKGETV